MCHWEAGASGRSGSGSMSIFLLKSLVFLASFLIFAVELILGKILLPGFGGGYLVWGVSVVFYQGVLFLGYLWVHFLNQRLAFRRFRQWQTALVAGSLLFLPLNIDRLRHPSYEWPMVGEIVFMLAATVGLLFFVLSGLSVYTQVHLSASTLPERKNPYVLFAASNLGAFAALLGYPFLIEPNLTLPDQVFGWQIGYVLVAVLFLAMQAGLRTQAPERPLGGRIAASSRSQAARWILLSAAPSAMFLAVTNEITFNIAPVPFLWVIPLALYLLTFVLSFKQTPFCPRFLQDRFYLFLSLGVVLFVFKATGNNPLEYAVLVLLSLKLPYYGLAVMLEPVMLIAIGFVFCLVCHYRLNQSRPQDPGQLTTYYIMLSAGGFLGGLLVNWIVPLVFNDTVELLIAFMMASVGFWIADPDPPPADWKLAGWVAGVLLVPLGWVAALNVLGPQAGMLIALVAGSVLLFVLYLFGNDHRRFSYALAGLVAVAPLLDGLSEDQRTVYRIRNHYGLYKVYDTDRFRQMKHGTTLHGAQLLDAEHQNEPVTYYHRGSPVGEVLTRRILPFKNVALVGLGTGTLAAYGQPGDRFDVFELDPAVGHIAQTYFTFLARSRAHLRMVYGDARVSLKREPDGKYQAIFIDVFNSSSIPVHLMTVEAMKEYLRVLDPRGALFFHITNPFLDLAPVLAANARQMGLHTAIKFTNIHNPPEQEATTWMLITPNQALHNLFVTRLGWRVQNLYADRLWTDDYSSLWSVLRR